VATVKTPASAWIDAALAALGDGGPDAVRVEVLAARLGVSKGGFYWHFADRGALLEQALDTWERTVVENVIAQIEGEPSGARDKLRQLFELAFASAESRTGLGAELAIRDWARRDPKVAERVRGIDERRMAYMRSLFSQLTDDEDAEARSLIAYSLFIGTNFIAARHQGRTREQVLNRALRLLLD
jgi:AcrR family transcriptional regulator